MLGIPVVGFATTEMTTVFQNDINGIIHTDIDYLTGQMQMLLGNKEKAVSIGKAGQHTAHTRFNIQRFTKDWEDVFTTAIKTNTYEQTNSLYQ